MWAKECIHGLRHGLVPLAQVYSVHWAPYKCMKPLLLARKPTDERSSSVPFGKVLVLPQIVTDTTHRQSDWVDGREMSLCALSERASVFPQSSASLDREKPSPDQLVQ